MEDLIPLIIVIAISIIGAIGRKKKRPEDRNITRPHQQTRRDDEIFSWLEKVGIEKEDISPFFGDEPTVSPVVREASNDSYNEIKEPPKAATPNKYAQFGGVITPEEREKIMSSEGIPVIPRKKVENDLTQKNASNENQEDETTKIDFDIRQAVIFSEILNRKYA